MDWCFASRVATAPGLHRHRLGWIGWVQPVNRSRGTQGQGFVRAPRAPGAVDLMHSFCGGCPRAEGPCASPRPLPAPPKVCTFAHSRRGLSLIRLAC